MKITKSKRRILNAIAVLAVALGGAYGAAKKTDLFDTGISARVAANGEEKELEIPSYNLIKVPPARCSQYARMCAEKVFGKHYSFANAWDRRYDDKLVCRADNLENLAESGALQPGMLVTWRNSASSYANGRDKSGVERNCSHVAVYIGIDAENKEPLFAEQRGTKKQVVSYSRFKNDGWTPVEVIDSGN